MTIEQRELTLQQAADAIGVSAAFLAEEVRNGHLSPNTAGRIKLSALTAYRQAKDAARRQALDELADQAQSLGFVY